MPDAPRDPEATPTNYSTATPPPATHGPSAGAAGAGAVSADEQWVPLENPRGTRPAGIGVLAALAIGALVGGGAGAGVGIWAMSANSPVSAIGNGPGSITINDPGDVNAINAVASNVSPSVVTISVVGGTTAGSGSGIVLSEDGYILTNTHVVTLDGATANANIRVVDSAGRLFTASIVGTDPVFDLAVIQVQGVTDMQPAEFADSSRVNVGDVAIAVGAPLGLEGTVTVGIVSALNRSITVASAAVPDEVDDETPEPEGETPFDFWFDVPGRESAPTPSSPTISLAVIQTDAAINPGNSGGALFDAQGQLIGVNVAIANAGGRSAGNIGVGFAIPSNVAQRVANELIQTGRASHGLLGASILNVTEDSRQADATTVGASVMEVTPGGAAAEAGNSRGRHHRRLQRHPDPKQDRPHRPGAHPSWRGGCHRRLREKRPALRDHRHARRARIGTIVG